MGDEPQTPVSDKEDKDDDLKEVAMEISRAIEIEERMEINYSTTDAEENNISYPDQLQSEIQIPMDDEGVYITRDRVMQDLFRSVAVWSCDSHSGATDIIPLITRFGNIEDLKDYWTGRQLPRWSGVVAVFRNCSTALRVAQELPELRIDGKWSLKAINIGLWLDKIYAIELDLNETEFKYHVTLVCVSNFNDALSTEEVRPSCEIFGPVVDITSVMDERNIKHFMIKYIYSADAYAAKWYMHGKGSGRHKLEVAILMSPKIAAIEREIRKNDMVIWNKS